MYITTGNKNYIKFLKTEKNRRIQFKKRGNMFENKFGILSAIINHLIDTKNLTVATIGAEITGKCLKTAENLRKIAKFI